MVEDCVTTRIFVFQHCLLDVRTCGELLQAHMGREEAYVLNLRPQWIRAPRTFRLSDEPTLIVK